MGTNKLRTKQDNYTKATSQLTTERQLQDISVLPGPKLKYHHCSTVTGEKEKRKAQINMQNLKPIPGEPQVPRGPGLNPRIQLQRHLLLGRHFP